MTRDNSHLMHGRSWAGLVGGPTAWALNTQLNYALLPYACKFSFNIVPLVAAVFAFISFFSAWLSWLAWHRYRGPIFPIPEHDGRPRDLLCGIGVGSGILFGLVIFLQGLASAWLGPCLR
jgi:hypothetical protein